MKDFDEVDALERTAGDRNLLGEVIRFALEDMPPLLVAIEDSLRNNLLPEAARLAHKIKGTAGACGAQKLYMAALNLELAARDSSGTSIQFLPPLTEAYRSFQDHPQVRELSSLDAGTEASIG